MQSEQTLEHKLVQLDCTVQALSAVQQLLSFCPADMSINANAMGHLLFVLHKEFVNVQRKLDEPDAQETNNKKK